ncbi:MAG: hypothetical protein IT371_30420 [Deltaproteobacteria bacterium]|nr:hypothetical protein [Deltaproteobacteria bacterium]
MSVFGGGGGRSGEDVLTRQKIMAEIESETDIARLAKLLAFDQVDYDYDPCGKSSLGINRHLTDLSCKVVARINALCGFEVRGE